MRASSLSHLFAQPLGLLKVNSMSKFAQRSVLSDHGVLSELV